jgi:hypothetical protein
MTATENNSLSWLKRTLPLLAGLLLTAAALLPTANAQKAPMRDEFFWLGQMNKATAVINTDEGLLDRAKTGKIAAGIAYHAKINNIKPMDFPYAQAQIIYKKAVAEYGGSDTLPMNETEFRATLDPVAIIHNRATSGGPQPAEMTRMLTLAQNMIATEQTWVKDKRARIDAAMARLDQDFAKLIAAAQ